MTRAVSLVALGLCGCTELNFRYYDEPSEGLPWFDQTPRWSHPVHTAELSFKTGQLILSASLPRNAALCESMFPGSPDCADDDVDGLTDLWEGLLLDRLRPAVQLEKQERLLSDLSGRAQALGRVFAAGDRVRVLLVIIYSRDYGSCSFTGHFLDFERVALDLEPAADDPAFEVRIAGMYAAAHEGESVDASTLIRHPGPAQFTVVEDPVLGTARWLVFASRNKHATYLTYGDCQAAFRVVCFKEKCAEAFESASERTSLLLPVRNVGEPGRPLPTAPRDPHHSPPISPLQCFDRNSGDCSFQTFCCWSPLLGQKLRHDPFFRSGLP